MNSINFLLEIQQQMNETFVSQDPELLDIVFVVEGKKLYADKLRLSLVSTTFKSMLSTRWTSKTDAIEIKDYKFDDFKEMLLFIYSGECSLNDANVIVMLDMAEYYQIKYLKELCDQYLSNMKIDFENVFRLMETSIKYFLIQVKEPIQAFVSKNFSKFIKHEQFLNANKLFVEGVISLEYIKKHDEIFQAVYKWSEYQVIKKQKESMAQNLNKNDAIKAEITPFLQYIQLKKMEKDFLNSYVVERDYLFPVRQLQNILLLANKIYKVKITNPTRQSISGSLSYNYNVIETIKSLKDRSSDNWGYGNLYWKTENQSIPSTSSPLKKRDDVEWYLVYSIDGNIEILKPYQITDNDYLIAEMVADTIFYVKPNCKIVIE